MLPPETRDRLAKLVPMLGSDRDGEVVAAVRAIERALKAGGYDWHDLVEVLVGRQTGWTPGGRPRTAAASPSRFNYADSYAQADRLHEGPEHPQALSRKFGLPIYSADRIEPWPEVARYCLKMNHALPSRHGGKFLQGWQKGLLRTLIDHRQPTNQHVAWIETVIARCHQARDAAARAAS